jgi:hypothetical protein
MKFSKSILTAALTLVTFASQASALNLVQNGSFEANTQAVDTWAIYQDLTDWTGGRNGIELRNSVAGEAQSGNNFVELDTTKNSSMSQVLTLTQGGTYQFSFWYAARPDNGSKPKATDSLEWSVDGTTGKVLQNWKTTGATTWQQFSQTFVFDAPQTVTLSFFAKGKSDSYGGSIDNVSFTNITPVPEPETYAMLLAGLGLMGTIARRRNKAKKAV